MALGSVPGGVCVSECECGRCVWLALRSLGGKDQRFTGTEGILGLIPGTIKELFLGNLGKGTSTRLDILMRWVTPAECVRFR